MRFFCGMTQIERADAPASKQPSRPSFSWVEATFLLMTASAAALEITSFDTWWHLAAGRYAVESGTIPMQETFSFTAAGTPWINHEWLFQLVVYGIHSITGEAGLVVFRTTTITLSAFLVLRAVRRETGWPAAAVCLGLTPFLLAARGRFLVRPELFTLLFAVLLLVALTKTRPRPPTLRDLWWIPLLFVPWANLHAGVLLGVALLGATFAGQALHLVSRFLGLGLRPPPVGRPSLATSGALLGLSSIAVLLNPFTYEIYRVPFHLGGLIATGIFRNSEWDPPGLPFSWLYFVILAATLLAIGRRWRCLDGPTLGVLALLVYLSLRHIRHGAIFAFLAPLLIAAVWRPEPAGESGTTLRRLRPAWVVALLLLLTLSFSVANPFGFSASPRFLPIEAVDWLAEHRPSGQLLNSETFGGLVAWRLGPEVPIFIDGRNEVFAEVQAVYHRAEKDQALWQQLLDRYDIGYALISYGNPLQEIVVPDPGGGPPKTLRRPFAASHFPRRHWALVYWDDTAMVYVRRTEAHRALIAEHEDVHVYPESLEFQMEGLARGRVDPARLRQELVDKIEERPESQRARRWLEALDAGPEASRAQP